MLQGFQVILHMNLWDSHSQPKGVSMVGFCVTDISQVHKLNQEICRI